MGGNPQYLRTASTHHHTNRYHRCPDATSSVTPDEKLPPTSTSPSSPTDPALLRSLLFDATAAAAAANTPFNNQRRNSSNGGTGGSVNAPVGIDALYYPATTGIDTSLQFQWMRIHPGDVVTASTTPFSLRRGSNVGPPAFIGTGSGGQRQKRKRDDDFNNRDDGNGVMSTVRATDGRPRDDDRVTSRGFDVSVTDLCGRPPLLTEWIPGLDSDDRYYSCHGEEEEEGPLSLSSLSSDDEREREDDHPGASCRYPKMNARAVGVALRDAALAEHCREYPKVEEEGNDGRDEGLATTGAAAGITTLPQHLSCHREMFESLTRLSIGDLSAILPSRDLLSAFRHVPKGYCFGIIALRLLSSQTRCEMVGKYILRCLSPVLLRRENYKGGEDVIEEEVFARREIQKLAISLIRECNLGNLSRRELNEIMMNGSGDEDGEGFDELRSCIGEAFFELRESVCR
mmetsp:Transcript_12570/g.15813  ORF Transcript_12570/g.15813 Transcript_12570/m.15813 type:complete len:458 (+) Transcript_12570:79-1452(+)|eukprot:CAMPEP_0172515016 /NCGR_PEP_ID=MMETSP1066-20121228/264602_1 /TAXON_ID=671091 /ORGANISM="Coscinodiscus wailesii, Strain CCMP2513" /LENGTH=457 /DNA_ID=CAMNT_0013295907 /DNA_START=72 /DNA_END=1445 /DNA_ORIENTATION=-